MGSAVLALAFRAHQLQDQDMYCLQGAMLLPKMLSQIASNELPDYLLLLLLAQNAGRCHPAALLSLLSVSTLHCQAFSSLDH